MVIMWLAILASILAIVVSFKAMDACIKASSDAGVVNMTYLILYSFAILMLLAYLNTLL